VSEIHKQREKWNKIKSIGKKNYVLKRLFLYYVLLLVIAIADFFVAETSTISNNPHHIIGYLLSFIILSPVGIGPQKIAGKLI
jgi:hypothetical protein